jgi:hypothetical protein
MILELMSLSAPATRIEFIQWRHRRLKTLDEKIMFLFCGPHLEPTHTFRVTSVILFCSEAKIRCCTFHPTKFMPDSLELEQQSQLVLCHFCSGSLQPTTNLEMLNYLKFWIVACEEQRVVARWQQILSSHQGITKGRPANFLFGQVTGLNDK